MGLLTTLVKVLFKDYFITTAYKDNIANDDVKVENIMSNDVKDEATNNIDGNNVIY